MVAVLEGMVAGVEVTSSEIADQLARRRLGYGRGARMKFEADKVTMIGGVRHGVTMGGPVAIEVANSEWPKWESVMSADPVPAEELDNHRRRMSLLLGVPALQAHSMIVYADWRQVIAEFCATRLGVDVRDHLPQTIGWLCLGAALAAYEKWLDDPDADLETLIESGARTVADGVAALA